MPFRSPARVDNDEEWPGTFNLLGFTHYWGKSRKGNWVVMKRTAKDRFSRALRRIREWCRQHRHDPLETQHLTLTRKLNEHYAYYGITPNFKAIARELPRIAGEPAVAAVRPSTITATQKDADVLMGAIGDAGRVSAPASSSSLVNGYLWSELLHACNAASRVPRSTTISWSGGRNFRAERDRPG